MLNILIQSATPSRGHSITSMLGHLGALGLFFIAIIDSSPLPTFGGPDILTAILAARQTNPWYEYAAVATAGSVIGAWFTFRIARRAGSAYLHSKFGNRKVEAMLQFFQIGHRCSCRVNSGSLSIPYKPVVRCGRCFKLPSGEISHGSDDLPWRTLHTCRDHRRSLWTPFCPGSAPPHPILGLVAAVRCGHPRHDPGRNRAEQTTRGYNNRMKHGSLPSPVSACRQGHTESTVRASRPARWQL